MPLFPLRVARAPAGALLGAALSGAGCGPTPLEVIALFEAEHGPYEDCGALPAAPDAGQDATALAADPDGAAACLLDGWLACERRTVARHDVDSAGAPLSTLWYLTLLDGECDVTVFRHGTGEDGDPWLTRSTCEDLMPQTEGSTYVPFALERCGDTFVLID